MGGGQSLNSKTNPSRRWRTALFILSVLLAGSALALNRSGTQLYADGIIPVLMSLYHWEPFFWETARYGMLIPFVAIPIAHPFWNLVFQYVISGVAFVAAPVLIARFIYGAKYGLAVGAAAGLVIVSGPARSTDIMSYATPGQPYAVALAFCYGGMCLLELASFRNFVKAVLGLLLIAAAVWLCPTVALNAVPIAFAKAFLDTQLERSLGLRARFRSAVRTALPLVSAVTVSVILSTAFTMSAASSEGARLTALLSPREWIDKNAFVAVARELNWFLKPVPYSAAFIGGLYILAIIITIAVRSKLARRLVLGGAAILLAGIVSEMLVLSTMRYIADSGFHGHYLFSCLLLLLIIPCAAIVIPALEAGWQRRLEPALLGCLVAAAVASYGWPSLSGLRASLDAACGRYTGLILANGVTHIAGSYWTVWPAVFHANLSLYERGSDRKVWSLTDRTVGIRRLWDTFDDRRNLIAALPGDDIRLRLDRFGIFTGFPQTKGELVLYPTIPRRNIRFGKEPLWPDSPISPGLRCTLDMVNGKSDPVISIDRWQRLELAGWAADVQAGTIPEVVGIELSSAENGRYYVQARRAWRGDVASSFKKPGLGWAGFALQLVETRVPTGEYSVHILQSSGTQTWSCDTGRRIRFY